MYIEKVLISFTPNENSDENSSDENFFFLFHEDVV